MNNPNKSSSELVGKAARIYERNGTWQVHIQFRGKQIRRSLKTSVKKEARRLALEFEQSLTQTPYHSNLTGKPKSLAVAVDEYLSHCEARGLKPKTMAKYVSTTRRLVEIAGEIRVAELIHVDLPFTDYYRKRRQQDGVVQRTIYNELRSIRSFVLFAKTRRMIPYDPLEGLRLSKPKSRPQPCWSRDEVQVILTAASPRHRDVFELLAETGLRIGELRWLTWADVDLPNNRIHIQPKDDWTTKTGNIRSVPLSQRAREVLGGQTRKFRWVFTAAPSWKYPDGGHQVSDRRLLESLKRTLGKVGLDGHMHTFRHSFISDSVVRGIPEAVIRSWVGHVDRETLRHYTHINDRDSQAAMKQKQEVSAAN
ncbi:MAG: tyrosine-type recombinase/integrase [Rubinisphaera brasiliensis]|uniref:tyrosine-type recombinase/integrase n=1 Tax=Rubinisphaera brasiliensis TaxID=119 RepID=UPI003918A5E5